MKPIFILLLLVPAGLPLSRAQPASAPGKQRVLILLRQPEGKLHERLAEIPSSTPVPEEVRNAASREQKSLVQAQEQSFEQRLIAAGATGVVHFPELNMMRAEIPQPAFASLRKDPAVISVTPLAEDAPNIVAARVPQSAIPSGSALGQIAAPNQAFMPPMQMPMSPGSLPASLAPGSMMPGAMPPGSMMPGATPMMGIPGTGGMFQSILGITGQMGMQAGTVMPHAAGMVTLFTGGAQIAQIIASRRQGCAILLATAATQLPETGGEGVIAVNAPPSCLWQAQSDADWLQITAGGPMMGPGIVKYTATPSGKGMLRSAVISIAGIAGAKVKGKTSATIRQGQ